MHSGHTALPEILLDRLDVKSSQAIVVAQITIGDIRNVCLRTWKLSTIVPFQQFGDLLGNQLLHTAIKVECKLLECLDLIGRQLDEQRFAIAVFDRFGRWWHTALWRVLEIRLRHA